MKYSLPLLIVSQLAVASLIGWLGWFYGHSSVRLNWPHPGQPTIYFSWHHRPSLVRHGVGKDVVLHPGVNYDFSVDAPTQARQARLTLATDRPGARLSLNGQALVPDQSGQMLSTDLDWTVVNHRSLMLMDEGSTTVTIRRMIFVLNR